MLCRVGLEATAGGATSRQNLRNVFVPGVLPV